MNETMEMRPGNLRADEIARMIDCDSPVMLEVGANNGADTERFLEAMPNISLFCFEPDPRPIVKFHDRIGPDLRCTLVNKAVSDTDGTTVMYRSSGKPPNQPNHDGDWDMSGSIFKPTKHLEYSPWVTFPDSHHLEVDTIRLDTWFKSQTAIDAIDFIWADVQGAEAAMVRGATETLARTRYLYTEIPFVAPGNRFDNAAMYEGQPTLSELREMLPTFELVAIYHIDNALFKNREIA